MSHSLVKRWGKLFIPEADWEIRFVKTPLRKIKENIKDNGIYVYLLGVRQLSNTFLILPEKK